jgi:hypothetical protein
MKWECLPVLRPGSPPFGYTKPDGRKSIPVQDPNTVLHVIRMKDMLLEGKSLHQIADYFNSQHIPPIRGKRWYPQTIMSILTNPFYMNWIVTLVITGAVATTNSLAC